MDEFTDNKTRVKSIRKVPEAYDDIKNYAQYRCPINHPTAMYRKAAVLAVGGYLTEYFPEDYFLWLRMLKNGSKFIIFRSLCCGFVIRKKRWQEEVAGLMLVMKCVSWYGC